MIIEYDCYDLGENYSIVYGNKKNFLCGNMILMILDVSHSKLFLVPLGDCVGFEPEQDIYVYHRKLNDFRILVLILIMGLVCLDVFFVTTMLDKVV